MGIPSWEMLPVLFLAVIGLPISLTLTRFFMKWNASGGIYGIDVHKLNKPKVPEMCGASMAITLVILGIGYATLAPQNILAILSFVLVVSLSALVGAADDKLRLRGVYKPLLGLLCGVPMSLIGLIYGHVYVPDLRIPLFGGYHLPIIYPLTIPVALSVTSNTVNMLDPLNGTMAGSVAIVSGVLLVGLILTGQDPLPVFLYSSLLFVSLGFYYYNRYPSRAFSGNVGQLSLGAALGASAILGRAEIATIVAMFPHIQNSFFFLSKIRRFTEHRLLGRKPTTLLEDGRLAASSDPKAPLTLVRTMLVVRPAGEKEVVHTIFAVFVFSSLLGLITLFLMGIVL